MRCDKCGIGFRSMGAQGIERYKRERIEVVRYYARSACGFVMNVTLGLNNPNENKGVAR